MWFGTVVFSAFLHVYGTPNPEDALSCLPTPGGGLLVVGRTGRPGAGDDALVMKLAPDGRVEWARALGGGGNDWATSAVQAGGGFLVAGWTERARSADILLFKLGPDGSLAWARTVGGKGWDVASWLVSGEGFWMVGKSHSWGAGGWDILAARLGPDGGLPCFRELDLRGTPLDIRASRVPSLSGSVLRLGVRDLSWEAEELPLRVAGVCK